MIEPNLYAQQGWQCPICKRIYSPLTPMCFYCGDEVRTTTATGVPYTNPDRTTCNTEVSYGSLDCWENSPILLTSYPPKLEWKCRFCGKVITTEVTEMPSKPCDCLSNNKSKGE